MVGVIILMGSRSDLEHGRKIAKTLQWFGITSELRIASAHKSPRHLLDILDEYEAAPGPKVYITVAGRSNALSGLVDAAVSAPVIACPPLSESFGDMDIFSSLRMPSGVAPAVVIEPDNAALLAAKILALTDPALQDKVRELQTRQSARLVSEDKEVRGEKAAGE